MDRVDCEDMNCRWDLDLSIIIPLKDEAPNVCPLREEIDAVMAELPYAWECLWIDDGSTDTTLAEIQRFNLEDTRHQYVALSPNCGQSAALYAGFCRARGKVLATLDGDGQNDPKDLPKLIACLNQENVDMVNGVRQKRQDTFVRRISSRIANRFRNRLTRENITDVGCSLRVFRHACVEHIFPFNGFHRFLPTLTRIGGYPKIAEMPVSHRLRKYGRTSYGIGNRMWVGIMDTLAVCWMQNRRVRPQIKSTSSKRETEKA